MKARNHYVYGDEETLKRLEEDYILLGRDVKRSNGRLTVFALPRKKAKRNVASERPQRKTPR